MRKTKIDWCDYTINPVIGCTFGCEYCYAEKINDRFHFIENFHKPQFRKNQLEKIFNICNSNIFMNSMSDIADWTIENVLDVISVIHKNPSNNYLFLTKRPNEICPKVLDNCWYGITITNEQETGRHIDLVRAFRENNSYSNFFISIEPLHSDIEFKLNVLNCFKWVIIGAETGNRKNKIIPKKEWIDFIVKQCNFWNIPIFMKESLKKTMGTDFIQQFPKELERGK